MPAPGGQKIKLKSYHRIISQRLMDDPMEEPRTALRRGHQTVSSFFPTQKMSSSDPLLAPYFLSVECFSIQWMIDNKKTGCRRAIVLDWGCTFQEFFLRRTSFKFGSALQRQIKMKCPPFSPYPHHLKQGMRSKPQTSLSTLKRKIGSLSHGGEIGT